MPLVGTTHSHRWAHVPNLDMHANGQPTFYNQLAPKAASVCSCVVVHAACRSAPNIILTAGSERQYCLSEIEWQFYPASWPRMPKAWLKDCTVANSRAIHLPSPDPDAVYLRLGHQQCKAELDRVQNKDERGGIYAWRAGNMKKEKHVYARWPVKLLRLFSGSLPASYSYPIATSTQKRERGNN